MTVGWTARSLSVRRTLHCVTGSPGITNCPTPWKRLEPTAGRIGGEDLRNLCPVELGVLVAVYREQSATASQRPPTLDVHVWLRSRDVQLSRTTSVGVLSSRKPRQLGCRSRPSVVHSLKATSPTKAGFTQ